MARFIVDRTKLERCCKATGRRWTDSLLAEAAGLHASDLSAATLKRTLSERHVEELSKVLGALPREFGFWLADDADSNIHCDLQDILSLYQSLRRGDVVCIASADGFLELHNPKLMQAMIDLLRRGVEVAYVYPAEYGRSTREYVDLRDRYVAEAGAEATARVRGLEVSGRPRSLFGWSARYILILTTDERAQGAQASAGSDGSALKAQPAHGRTMRPPAFESASRLHDVRPTLRHQARRDLRVRQVFIYAVGITPKEEREGRQEGAPLWVRQPHAQAEELAGLLLSAMDPIPDLTIVENRLYRPLQQCYREAFGRTQWAEAYRRLRDEEAAKVLVREITRHFSHSLPSSCESDPPSRETRLLDIGTGDGWLFNRLVPTLAERTDVLWPVLLDSTMVPIPTAEEEDARGQACVKWVLHPFEQFKHPGLFDLIVAVHAFYLIDPSYIKKAYQLLAQDGHLFLVTSPRDRNAINALARAVDETLINLKGWHDALPTLAGEEARKSLRVYSEDLIAEAHRVFGVGRVDVTLHECPVLRGAFLDQSGELSPSAKDMIRVFADRVLAEKELEDVVFPRATALLTEMCTGDRIRNEITVVHLSKSEIGRAARWVLC